jgi:Uma2 family endonuclease
MSARQKDLRRHIEYPASDGKPMAETDKHRQLMVDLIESLKHHFTPQADVYVSGNMLMYYIEGDPTKSVAPDVFVVRGVAKHERRIYKLWEEGQAPQVVFEISSRGTKNEDLQWKKQLYAWFGVREYFIFDPEYKLKPSLRAFRLRGRELIEEVVTEAHVKSDELALELVDTGQTLRLLNPQTNEFLPTPAEEYVLAEQAQTRAQQEAARAEQEAARAEQEAARAEQEAARAEQEAARAVRLAAKLRELGINPDEV